ncbi:unnamed protein product [Calicophoron daubneyi]
MDESMVTQWRNLFDKNNTGRITLQEFCDTLGLKVHEVRIRRESLRRQQAPQVGLRSDVHVITANMPLDQQIPVADEVYRIANEQGLTETEKAQRIKSYLEKNYGRIWDVVTTDASSWSSLSHISNTLFYFELNNRTYLIWKTPE